MSNAGKLMINWRHEFPILRVALAYLGEKGYRSRAARYVMDHGCAEKLQEHCKGLGRPLTVDAVYSRMAKTKEVKWYEVNAPEAHRKGLRLGKSLEQELIKAGYQWSENP